MGPLVVQLTFVFAYAILAEAALSFLGIGPPPPAPSWGNIIAEGRDYSIEAWWIMLFPGIAISLAALGMNLLGDGLRDVLDPRLKVESLTDLQEPVLSVEDLTVEFRGDSGWVTAVRDVGFTVGPNECLGIVGESGSGKSVSALSILRLHAKASSRMPTGRIRFGGRDLLTEPEREMRTHPRRRDRDDLPGSDVVAEPGADHRRPDHASRCGCTRAWTARLPAGGRSNCSTWSAFRMRPGGWTSTRTVCRAACGSG